MKQKALLSIIFIFISTLIFAQGTITISGVVRDETKHPLPGATVSVPGTTIGTTTDSLGKYSLAVPRYAKTVVISYIGYDNKEYPIKSNGGDVSLNADMSSSDISLNQVVVSVSKEKEKLLDAPASITIIGKDKLESNVVTTPVDELKGTAGVDIMRTGLISSNVVIRGFNNIFSGDVLNVVDDRIGSVPSLQVNAYQLVPTSYLDYDKIEVIRGPASALYGPNASSGVIAITTKSPLEQVDQFETTVAMTSGFTVLGTTPEPNATGGMSTYRQDNGGKALSGNIINPEFRHSGRTKNGIFGYKISAGYFQGQDYPNYDPREPYAGDSVVFGSVHNGNTFTPDTLQKYTHVANGKTITDSVKLDIRRFKKDFFIRKYNADARFDIKPTKDILITVNGGLSSSHNVELTGLGAAQAGGPSGWIYWYLQTKFKWRNLFIQYFINSSDAGETYLIPQISQSDRGSTPYQVQLLIDKSKLHVLQIQHSWRPITKLNFVYGGDAQFVRPNTEGTINGLFEPVDYVNMAGLYLQGTYDPLKWLKLVAAFRADYNSIINNVAASPRAAIVFKVAENQDIRLTYNRAFDAPNTLDQFLDLAQTQLPDGMYARGIGNPYGYNYPRDANGNIEFTPAPWGGANSVNNLQPVAYNSTAANVAQFDSIENYMIKTFAAATGSYNEAKVLIDDLFNGIGGPNGTVANASHLALNLNNFGSTNNYQTSLIPNPTNIQNLKKINNQYTQTLELGYKGFLFHKLNIQVDAYWTRINNYVSALTPASEAVVLNNSFLGPDNSTGQLYKNLYANNGLLNNLLKGALDGVAALQNPTITPPVAGSVWDEVVVLLSQLPIGDITPQSKYVNSDYILTFENLGRLDLFGLDASLQYNVFETNRHDVVLSGTVSYVDKDQFTLSTGQGVPLNAPKAKMSISFNHTLKQSGFGYGLQFRYQMPYYGESAVYEGEVAPMYILDAQVSYRLKWYKKLLLAINVNNVTNYQWSAFPGTPLMGTQVYVKAQVTF